MQLAERRPVEAWLPPVLRLVVPAVRDPRDPLRPLEDALVEDVARAVPVLGEGPELLGVDLLEREPVEDLLRTLRDVARAGEPDDERPEARGQPLAADPVADAGELLEGVVEAGVLVREPHVRQRRGEALGGEALPERPERVEHPGVPGVPAEEDEASAPAVGDRLVVDERRPELEEAPQHRHVRALPLDDVGEVDVGPARPEFLDRDLLHPQDDTARVEVSRDLGPGGPVRRVVERAQVRGLDAEGDAVLADQLGDVVGRQRRPTLPAVLVLFADPDRDVHPALLPRFVVPRRDG